MIIQPRDLGLFRELAVLRVADREQVKLAGGFGSTTRANARLLALTRAGLLRRFFLGRGAGRRALYALSEKAAKLIDVPLRGPRRKQNAMLVADYFVEHQLAINELYCGLKFCPIPVTGVQFLRWTAFHESIAPALRLIPDGYVELATPSGTIATFVEIDLGHESLAVWKEKIRQYLQLAISGEYARRFGQSRFRVIVLVNSPRRLGSIRKAVAAITQKLFWLATIDDARENFFGAIWLRPTRESHEPFIQEHP